jgi:hypothetical protein
MFGLKPRQSPELVTQVIDIILVTVAGRKFLPGDTGAAMNFIIDSAVDDLFE